MRQSRQRRRGCHGVESLSRSAPLTSISPPASKFTIQRPRHWSNACSTPLCTPSRPTLRLMVTREPTASTPPCTPRCAPATDSLRTRTRTRRCTIGASSSQFLVDLLAIVLRAALLAAAGADQQHAHRVQSTVKLSGVTLEKVFVCVSQAGIQSPARRRLLHSFGLGMRESRRDHVGGYGAQLRHAAELSPVERVRELEARRHHPGKTCHTPTFPQLACSCRRARGTGPLCPQCQRGRAAAAAATLQHGQQSLQSAACAREAAVRQAGAEVQSGGALGRCARTPAMSCERRRQR